MSRRPPGRAARGSGFVWWLLCLAGGALQAASIAWPFQSWGLPGTVQGQPNGWWQIVALAMLVLALQYATRVGQAVWRGWVFATVWLAGTFWWLFISLHTYGGLPAWLAVLSVLALAGLLAIYYAVGMGFLCAWAPLSRTAQGLMFASLWTLAELARAHWFTGFPWGAVGYAQVDLMAPWAPLVGVYGMGFLAALLAYSLASVVSAMVRRLGDWLSSPTGRRQTIRTTGGVRIAAPAPRVQARLVPDLAQGWTGALRNLALLLVVAALLWSLVGGAAAWRGLGQRETAATGDLRVWLLQGNIAQDQKFQPGTGIAQALSWYPQQMAEAAHAARSSVTGPQLVVAPETAVPLLPGQLGPNFWQPLLGELAREPTGAGVNTLLGLPLGSLEQGYTNSVWGLTPGAAHRLQSLARLDTADNGLFRYDKHHLVPFGEFIPPLFRWFTDLMNIPLGDFNRGALGQPAWAVAGQRIAPNICYEDLFGEELAASFRDPTAAPTVLINLSNIAWFGDSIAIDQHLQISRLRAIELGRPMLRATNTGATAVIDHQGKVTHELQRLTRGRLEATVQGRSGITPYARWTARWGLAPLWVGCLALALLIASARNLGRRGGRTRRR